MVLEVQFLPVVRGLPEVLVVQHFRLVLAVLAVLVHHLAQMDRRVRVLLEDLVVLEVQEILENKVCSSNFRDTFIIRDVLNILKCLIVIKQNKTFHSKTNELLCSNQVVLEILGCLEDQVLLVVLVVHPPQVVRVLPVVHLVLVVLMDLAVLNHLVVLVVLPLLYNRRNVFRILFTNSK